MIYIVLMFLFASILFYLIFGGADFGVGVLELFSSKKNRELNKNTIYRVIGPVWEANHVWLILVLVILWVGFPGFYSIVMIQMHLPLTLLLIGIVFRGSAFIFRHYDAKKDGSQAIYDRVFEFSSLICTFLIGTIAGGLVSGKLVQPEQLETTDFYTGFVASWLNPFSLSMGLFFTGIAAYLSATYLIGESQGKQTDYFRKKMIWSNGVTVFAGALVFIFAYRIDAPFLNAISTSIWSIAAVGIATLLLFPIWKGIATKRKRIIRIYVTAQIFLILFAYVISVFPNLMFVGEEGINLLEMSSPETVISNLGIMLIIGGILIIPGIYHLFKTFGLIRNEVKKIEE